jgi:S1-C subfamily serine protease
VSSSSGLASSARKGIIPALRLADDVLGAGQGFRLLPFTAAVSSGAGGGRLVESQGALLGIITKRIAPGTPSKVIRLPVIPAKAGIHVLLH